MVAQGNAFGTDIFESKTIGSIDVHGIVGNKGVEDKGRSVRSEGKMPHLKVLTGETSIKTQLQIVGSLHLGKDKVIPTVVTGDESYAVGTINSNVFISIALGGYPASRQRIVVVLKIDTIG